MAESEVVATWRYRQILERSGPFCAEPCGGVGGQFRFLAAQGVVAGVPELMLLAR